MLLSLPLWAVIVSQMCSNWSYYTLLTSLPTYMDNILHFDLKSVRFASFSCLKKKLVGPGETSFVDATFPLFCVNRNKKKNLFVSVQNSFLSAVPYLGAWLFSVLCGVIADLLIEKEIFSVTFVRKLFTLAGKEGCFLCIGLVVDAN